jgi:hypothetical protein
MNGPYDWVLSPLIGVAVSESSARTTRPPWIGPL